MVHPGQTPFRINNDQEIVRFLQTWQIMGQIDPALSHDSPRQVEWQTSGSSLTRNGVWPQWTLSGSSLTLVFLECTYYSSSDMSDMYYILKHVTWKSRNIFFPSESWLTYQSERDVFIKHCPSWWKRKLSLSSALPPSPISPPPSSAFNIYPPKHIDSIHFLVHPLINSAEMCITMSARVYLPFLAIRNGVIEPCLSHHSKSATHILLWIY